MTRLILICALLSACASAPTTAQCERWAEAQPGYSGNAVDNILHRADLIDQCLGLPPRKLP